MVGWISGKTVRARRTLLVKFFTFNRLFCADIKFKSPAHTYYILYPQDCVWARTVHTPLTGKHTTGSVAIVNAITQFTWKSAGLFVRP